MVSNSLNFLNLFYLICFIKFVSTRKQKNFLLNLATAYGRECKKLDFIDFNHAEFGFINKENKITTLLLVITFLKKNSSS